MWQLKLVNQLATVKDDGTVQFEVPGDIKPADVVHDGGFEDIFEDTPEIQHIPPMQIVMLIVGTRGDVQPFVAIGKRLQVLC